MIKKRFLKHSERTEKITLSKATEIIKRPIVTEKLSKHFDENFFYFEVEKNATKMDIAKACVLLYGIKVVSVNTMIKKFGLSRFKQTTYQKSDIKKAYVKFAEKIDINKIVKGVS